MFVVLGLTGQARGAVVLESWGSGVQQNNTAVAASFSATPTAGNLLIAIAGNVTSTTAPTAPTGWTLLQDDTGNAPGQVIYYKIAGPAEPTNVTIGPYPATLNLGMQLYEYSGVNGVDPLDSTTMISGSGATVATGNISTSADGSLVLAAFAAAGRIGYSGWTNSFVEEWDFANGGAPAGSGTYAGADLAVGAAGTYSTSATLDASAVWIGHAMVVNPLPPPSVVTNTANSGYGSLHDAIDYANLNPGTTITFDIPDTDPGYQTSGSDHWWRISPTGALPTITAASTIIDGTSQTTNRGDLNSQGPEIEVNGAAAGAVHGFLVTSANNLFHGLIINGFAEADMAGVRINGAGATLNTVSGCYIGTDFSGTNAVPNNRGIAIYDRTTVNTIGGTTAAERNVISGNSGFGIMLSGILGNATTDNVIVGNYIGTTAAGDAPLANNTGIYMNPGTGRTTIGGTDPAARNVISGNSSAGIQIGGSATTDNEVIGNFIGTDATGTTAIGNNTAISLMTSATGNTIGGTTSAHRNIIAGGNYGIHIYSNANLIVGNYIGTDVTGTVALGQGFYPVYFTLSGQSNVIGGISPGEGNLIAHSGGHGIYHNGSGAGNQFRGNSIHSSGGRGIQLVAGANNDKLPPVLSSVTTSGSDFTAIATVVSGDVIDFYRVNNPSSPVVTPDPSGSGEGFLYLGSCSDGGVASGPHISSVVDADPAAGALEVTLLNSGLGGSDYVTITATNATDGTSAFAANVQAAASSSIAGTVFEDIVGDVLDDGAIGDVNNPGAAGVDVYLYLDDGDSGLDGGDTLIGGAPQSTDGSGHYSFAGLSDGDYFVVVDSKTVGSTQDPAAVQADIWAEQTYGPVGGYYDTGIGVGIRVSPGPCYGGIAGHLSDDFSQWDDREHRAIVTVSGSDISNVDFGFSFNVVTNLVGGDARDDDVGANRTVQGSLRQFIQNANAINVANAMRFVPAELPGVGDGLGNLWWRLLVSEVLPTITGDGTTIDGRAFEHTDGTTLLDPNAAQTGAGLAVGTEGTYTTPKLDPELEVRNDRAVAVVPTGLVFEANDSVLRHISIWGFGDSAGTFDTNVRFGTNYGVTPDFTGSLAEFNVIGTGPASFTEPGAADRSGQKNLTMRETDGAIVRDNLIGFAGGVGVDFNSASSSGVVLRNEIRRNGIVDPIGNPVGVWVSGSVTGNLITDNASGIYSGPTPGISYHDNTITANGWGGTRPDGIRASGSSESIQRNVIANNAGAAVVVQSTTSSIQVSRNSIYGNGTSAGQIGIDLLGSGDDPIGGPFVTINDNLDIDSGGNDLLNFPVIDTADIQGSDLIVTGWARPGSEIEFYLADPDPSGFGEGKTWLITKSEGSGDDTDATTGTYGPGAINGIVQGTDDTNVFSFTIPLAAMAAPVGFNDEITALAYLGGNTSEFSGNVAVSPPTYTLSGTVFEDADFAGTASAYDGGTTDLGLANVDVEIYDGAGDAYVASTVTAADGTFGFAGLADGTYKVRVRSATIGDADTPPGGGLNATVPATWPYPLPEMTWAHGGALVGGQDPAVGDTGTGDNAGPGDTYVMVTVSGADVSGVDLGFSYELIVNVDDDATPDNVRSKQGTLRQFIKNANAIMSSQHSRFDLAGPDPYLIQPVGALPSVVDPVVLDGWSEPDFIDVPIVVIDGGLAGVGVDGLTMADGADGSTIRGFVISGFGANGISAAAGADGMTIAGNFVGTDATGTVDAGNAQRGIRIESANNVIGGLLAIERNVISGNDEDGVVLTQATAVDNTIIGNYIGIAATGIAELGNSNSGVFINVGCTGAVVGGDTAAQRNVISGNDYAGVNFSGSTTTVNLVSGNFIGTDASGVNPLGNRYGVVAQNGANRNRVGGSGVDEGNLIAHNNIGVVLAGGAGTTENIALLGNMIFSNNNIGIDINLNGVTGNDPGDADTGPNDLRNFPEITSAVESTGMVNVDFDLDVPAGDYRIEFFKNPNGVDPTHGEGEVFAGAIGITHGGTGPESFSHSLPGAVGDRLTATTTDSLAADLYGNTSEFSAWFAVTAVETHSISGVIFEDANFAGTATDYDGGANDAAQPNVDVELYTDADAYISSTSTDAGGSFSFGGLADGSYKVRVRSATLGDPDTPPAGGYNANVPGTWPYPLSEMTWASGSALIGGQDPTADDTATGDNAGPGDTYVAVTVSGADVSGVNFGFNYEVIVNDGDDTNSDNVRSTQGTLRQFIKNSNAIVGVNKSWFQIPGP